MSQEAPRIVIIGGGPAGYEAATAGAKYGAHITLVEEQGPGGSSVLLDCVPSKSFIAGANIRPTSAALMTWALTTSSAP